MTALIAYFWRLCRLQTAPQELPASRVLLILVLIPHMVVGWMLERVAGVAENAVLSAAGSTVVMVVLINLLLAGAGHPYRAVQTLSALAGSQVLIGAVAWLLHFLLDGVGEGGLLVPQLLLMAWSFVVTAHILRHALSTSLGWGMVATLGYLFVSLALLGPLYQSPG